MSTVGSKVRYDDSSGTSSPLLPPLSVKDKFLCDKNFNHTQIITKTSQRDKQRHSPHRRQWSHANYVSRAN